MLSYIPDVECVDEASGGEGAAAFVRGCGADVTLLDVRMPGVDGIAALDEILSDNPDANVIMLSTSDAKEDIFRAVSMGAKGYLLKESDPQVCHFIFRECPFDPIVMRLSSSLPHNFRLHHQKTDIDDFSLVSSPFVYAWGVTSTPNAPRIVPMSSPSASSIM